MPVRVPTLDDRSFDDLVAEALARVPVHNPEWTNFNRSDPGVTLVELFAFLTDTLLYRANLIPERNRLKFLSMLGVPLRPASSARGIVCFTNKTNPPLAHALTPGVRLGTDEAPFLTERGLDVLPVEAVPFYKLDAGDLSEEARRYYTELYQASTAEAGASAPRFYRTLSLESAGAVGVDLGETLDRSLWIALLAPPRVAPEAARLAIAGRILTLAWVPAVDELGRTLEPGVAAAATTRARLTFRVPRWSTSARGVPEEGGVRAPRYVPLQTEARVNVLTEPGIIELALPAEDALGYWDNIEPLEPGVGDFPPSLEDTTLEARLITWLRVELEGAGAARVLWAGVNCTEVTQRRRTLGEVLPDGTGEPDQSAVLAQRPVLPGSVNVRVLPAGGQRFDVWSEVDDLLAAGPEVPVRDPRLPPGRVSSTARPSRVFQLDAEAGELRFGDGLRGARPPRGARIVADYDQSAGARGNLGPGAVRAMTPAIEGVTVANPIATWGGADAEDAVEGEKHVTRYLQHRDRLVTAADFEAITWRTPGVAVGRVDVVPSFRPIPGAEPLLDAPGAVTVMVLPRYDAKHPDAPEASREFIGAVCAWLEPRRLVTTELILRGPEYVDVTLSLGVEVVPGASAHEVIVNVQRAVRSFLHPLPEEGVAPFEREVALLTPPQPSIAQTRRGWPLFKPVVALEVLAVASRVPGVLLVREVALGARGGTAALDQVDLRGLELPRLAALSVLEGSAAPLNALGGVPSSGVALLPVPVVPEVCG